jgi:hypothetical protein
MKWCVPIVAIVVAGCGDVKRGIFADPAAKWTPDPAHAGKLATTDSVAGYSLAIPTGFARVPLPNAERPTMTMAVWKKTVAADANPAILSVSVASDPKTVGEIAKPRQLLVNFLAGLTDAIGIKVDQRDATETGTVGAFTTHRFHWTGNVNGIVVAGFVSGFQDESRVVLVSMMAFPPTLDDDLALLQSAVATIVRK